MTTKRSIVWSACAMALLSPAWSHAADICWVERVKRTAAGVEVYFSSDRTVTVSGPDRKKQSLFQTYSARSTTVYQQPGAELVEAVPAALGDHLFSANSSHDTCTLVVARRDGRIGLVANAAVALPGLPPNSAEKFIVAE